jgi:heme exporter protein B
VLKTFRFVVYRDLLLAGRRPADVLTALVFFVLVATLFPLAVGPEPQLLREIASGVIWIAALFASMLSVPRMFASDHADGTLEQLLLSASPLGVIVVAKIFAHWLIAGLPLVLMSPILALQYGVDRSTVELLPLTLLIGTPVLSLIGAIGAGLTLGVRAGGVLLSVLVLPLYVPVLVIGTAAVDTAASGLSAQPYLLVMGALLVLAAAFAPWAAAAAVRISMD